VRDHNVKRVALVLLMLLLPLRSAEAYIDPNSAGSLYQFLFPMLVALASGIAATRHWLKRIWARLAATMAKTHTEPAGKPTSDDAKRDT
jgi:putative effector of murein hydrolase